MEGVHLALPRMDGQGDGPRDTPGPVNIKPEPAASDPETFHCLYGTTSQVHVSHEQAPGTYLGPNVKRQPLPGKKRLLVIGRAEQRAAGAGQEQKSKVRGLTSSRSRRQPGRRLPSLCYSICMALGKSLWLSKPQFP